MNKVVTFHVIWMSFQDPQLYSTSTKLACHIAFEPEVQKPRWRPLNQKCTICKLADNCIVKIPTATPIYPGLLNSLDIESILQTSSEVTGSNNSKMAAAKPEVHCIYACRLCIIAIPMATPINKKLLN